MLIALICIGALLGGIAALLGWIGKNVESMITHEVHTYLVERIQEYATCTPFVEKKIVCCTAWQLAEYLKKEYDNVKVTVTKLD